MRWLLQSWVIKTVKGEKKRIDYDTGLCAMWRLYLAITKNEIMVFAWKLMEIEIILLSLTKDHLFPFISGMWGWGQRRKDMIRTLRQHYGQRMMVEVTRCKCNQCMCACMRLWQRNPSLYTIDIFLFTMCKIVQMTPWAECYHESR